MSATIALLTDFGLEDIYVGVMKGVLRGICPQAALIDITHHVPPQSVRGGALALLHSYAYMPKGTVFLVVIDPGVGSARHPIAVKTQDYTFVAPDNGVLSYALAELGAYEVVRIQERKYFAERVSPTFHGRDVFAPVAAHLAAGNVTLVQLGEPLPEIYQLRMPLLEAQPYRIRGEVTHIDHFGNVLTSIRNLYWTTHGLRFEPMGGGEGMMVNPSTAKVTTHNDTIYSINRAYYEVPRGQLMMQVDSNNCLEISINQGDAAARLGVNIGDEVELSWHEEE